MSIDKKHIRDSEFAELMKLALAADQFIVFFRDPADCKVISKMNCDFDTLQTVILQLNGLINYFNHKGKA